MACVIFQTFHFKEGLLVIPTGTLLICLLSCLLQKQIISFILFFFLLLYSGTPYHPLLNVPHLFNHLKDSFYVTGVYSIVLSLGSCNHSGNHFFMFPAYYAK